MRPPSIEGTLRSRVAVTAMAVRGVLRNARTRNALFDIDLVGGVIDS